MRDAPDAAAGDERAELAELRTATRADLEAWRSELREEGTEEGDRERDADGDEENTRGRPRARPGR